MTTAFEFAQQLGLTGTDSEIVAQLAALGVTERPISLAYLMEMLNLRGMLRKTDGSGGQERWVGTLQNLKAALVALNQTEAVTAYETWFSHVTNPRQVSWDTTLPEYAAGFWSMKQSFAGVENMPSVEDFAAVAALGGGWLFADLTTEQFAAQRQSAIDVEVAADLFKEWSTLLNESLHPAASDRATLIGALRSAADTLESI